jgi:hypothetical protein
MGALNGFDRLRFRGTLRWLCYGQGLSGYLTSIGVPLKQFKEYTQAITQRVRSSIEGVAQGAGRPIEYLEKPSIDKEAYVRRIAERDGIQEGLIAVLHAVEPCYSFRTGRNPVTGHLEAQGTMRKCTHYYSYWMDPQWGFCHVRMQTWFPLTVHICTNGRERLARQMAEAGLGYRRRENCFVWVEDVEQAQALLDEQLRTNWSTSLEGLLRRSHPDYAAIANLTRRIGYYWSGEASEWASDVMFRRPSDLRRLHPELIAHGMRYFGSREVLRFLGRRVPTTGGVNGKFTGEVTTDLRERPEGVRIKHRVGANSIKMYDKQGSVLRVETTINDPRDFKIFRRPEGHPRKPQKWRILRKGVADMHRRAEVSQKANERYLESLAAVGEKTPLGSLVQGLCRPARWKGRRVRALNPLSAEDARLLETVNRGEFTVNGFRNRDLREHLYGLASHPDQGKRQSSAITRQLRLLRAHRLIRKVPKTHRYVVSSKGRTMITALLAARAADTNKMTEAAA